MNTQRDTLLLAGAIHSGLFAVFHLLFWRLFAWKTELRRIHPVNRGIMPVLNLCLTYVFAGLGLIVAFNRTELLSTRLGTQLMLFLAGFWLLRLVAQFIWFSTSHWASWVLASLFLAGAMIYAAAAWGA